MANKVKRIITETLLLIKIFGIKNIECSPDMRMVKINKFVLPDGLNRKITSVLIVFPPGYGIYDKNGHTVPIEEIYVDPGLRYIRNGREIEINNYFGNKTRYKENIHLLGGDWYWVCISQTKKFWTRQENVTTLLQQLLLLLSDPERHNTYT